MTGTRSVWGGQTFASCPSASPRRRPYSQESLSNPSLMASALAPLFSHFCYRVWIFYNWSFLDFWNYLEDGHGVDLSLLSDLSHLNRSKCSHRLRMQAGHTLKLFWALSGNKSTACLYHANWKLPNIIEKFLYASTLAAHLVAIFAQNYWMQTKIEYNQEDEYK